MGKPFPQTQPKRHSSPTTTTTPATPTAMERASAQSLPTETTSDPHPLIPSRRAGTAAARRATEVERASPSLETKSLAQATTRTLPKAVVAAAAVVEAGEAVVGTTTSLLP